MSLSESLGRKYAALSPFWRQMSHVFLVAILAAIVSAVLFEPAKTNRVYLKELIETNMLEGTASELIARLRTSSGWNDISATEWQRIEEGLRACFVKQASVYLASDDPYLSQRANSETPMRLAGRFMRECGL